MTIVGIARVVVTLVILGIAAWLYSQDQLTQVTPATIQWSTESEVDTAGFHIYRSESEEGPWERVSEQLIRSNTDGFSGGDYAFEDPTVEAGKTYFYQLEELETTGTFTRLPDTVRFDAQLAPKWEYVTVLAGAMMLVWLLPTPGDRRKREQPVTEQEPA